MLAASAISVSLLRGASLNVANVAGIVPRHPGRFSGSGTDTLLIYGPHKFTHTGSSSLFTDYGDVFDADSVNGRRYIVEVVNSSCTAAKITINGQDYLGSSEFGSGTTRVLRVVDVTQCAIGSGGNALDVSVKGSGSASVSVRIVRVSDPTFIVYGPKTFTQPTPAAKQPDSFPIVHAAKSPYTLRVINGSGGGSNRVSNATLSVNGVSVIGSTDLGAGIATKTFNATLDTVNLNRDTLYNQTATGTYLSLRFTATDSTPPAVTVSAPSDSFITAAGGVRISGSVTDETYGILTVDTLTVSNRAALPTPGAFSDSLTLPLNRTYLIRMHAMNSAWLSADVNRVVIRDTRAPTLVLTRPTADATVTATADTFTIAGYLADSTKTTVTVDGDTILIGSGNSVGFTYLYHLDVGQNGVTCRAIDALGHKYEFKRWIRRLVASETPRDSNVAGSVATSSGIRSFKESVQFLFTGSSPIQTGADSSLIFDNTASVVRGKVMGRDASSLPNVTVSVLNHSEYGQTLTRDDGWFSIVVNGGRPVTLCFSKAGYLGSQRQVATFTNDYAIVDSVAMVGKSALKSVVDLSAGQFSRSRRATDANGDRDMRLLFKPGTVAKVIRPSGAVDSFSNHVQVRVSEYTIGGSGPSAMPAALPPGSAYSYCVDYSLDEADSIAAINGQPFLDTQFSKPVIGYMRNFLHLPVGSAMPNGFYDSKVGQWKADTDAVVIKIRGFSGDTAQVDVIGHDSTATQAQLDHLSIDTYELTHLKSQFAVGDTLVRQIKHHFSTGDLNPPEGPPQTPLKFGSRSGLITKILGLFGCISDKHGSIIECESCVLGEQLPITGSPFTLNYRSYRQPGEKALRTLRIPTLGDSVPPDLSRIITYLDVAGRRYKSIEMHPVRNDSVIIMWDGKDAYGRLVDGTVPAHVSIGYEFPPTLSLGTGGASFGDQAATTDAYTWQGSGERSVPFVTWIHVTTTLGVPSTVSDGLGGWTLSPHHTCNVIGEGGLYRGDGTVVLGDEQHAVITDVAGCISVSVCPDDTSCVDPLRRTLNPNDVEVGPDGAIYIADGHLDCIYRLRVGEASMCRIAGTGSRGHFVDNVAATLTPLRNPRRMALGADGSIYFVMDFETNVADGDSIPRVAKITPDGVIHGITSKEPAPYPYYGRGDGGPALAATIGEAKSIALGQDGSVFVGDYGGSNNNRVRRISPNGIITTYAGGVGVAPSDNPGKATTVGVGSMNGLAVDAEGNLYIAQPGNTCVKIVTRNGIMSNLIKGATTDFNPEDIAIGYDGALYITSAAGDTGQRIYRRDTDGNLSVVAGVASGGSPTSGGYATATGLTPYGLGIGPNGEIYVAANNSRVLKIKKPFPTHPMAIFTVASDDASEIYAFDKLGRHLWTRDALTGAVRYLFNYDTFGRLSAIYDANGDSTRITRDGNGKPTSIIAPYGQTTTLSLSGDYLHAVVNPAGETVTLGTDGGGLLTSFKDAKNQEHVLSYNSSDGRLHVDNDPESGSQTLVSSIGLNKHHITHTTALGRTTTYDITTQYDGSQLRSTTGPDGLSGLWSETSNGVAQAHSAAGLTIRDSIGPNAIASIGMLAPTVAREVATMPSGLKRLVDISETADPGFGTPLPVGVWSHVTNINSRAPFTATLTVSQGPFLGKLVSVSAAGNRDSVVIDTAGRPLSLSILGFNTLGLAYDGHGRLTAVTRGGQGWRYGYDSQGRLATIRDTLGRLTALAYDGADRETLLTYPDGRQVHFGYDASGNVISVTPPGSHAHSFDVSGVDQTLRYTPPAVSGVSSPATSYTYNNDHQLTRITRPDGSVVSLAYNSTKGRLDSLTVDRGRAGFFYNATSGQIDSLSSPDTVSVHYAYDGDLLTSEQWTGHLPGITSLTVSRSFTAQLQESTQTVGSTSAVSYTHNLDGLLIGAGSLSIHRNAQHGLPDSTAAGSLTSSADYDGAGALANLSYSYGGSLKYRQSLARDAIGRVTAISEYSFGTSRSYGYRYDLAGRLYGVTLNSDTIAVYSYDADGNRASFKNPQSAADTASATYDQQDRMLRYKDTAYSYTGAGGLATKVSGADTTTYSYDVLGSLTRVKLPSGEVLTYSVDGTGRRVGRRLNGHWTGGWVYQSALSVVGELDSTGSIVNRYIYGPQGHVPALIVRGDSTYRLITDQLGSVRAVVNVATGFVLQQTEYDAWGVPSVVTGAGIQQLGYMGGLTDRATGLVRFGARDCDPSVGRWTTRDPLGIRLEPNLYSFVTNDPLDYIDPEGTTYHSNLCFLLGWLLGALPNQIQYAPNSIEAQEMMRSPGAAKLRQQFYDSGLPRTFTGGFDTPEAFWQTVVDPRTADLGSTAVQVGGFAGATVTNNGDGTATFTIDNTAGTNSFFYHAVPNLTRPTGPMSTVRQRFIWSEKIGAKRR